MFTSPKLRVLRGLCAAFPSFVTLAQAAPGDLDTSFSSDGIFQNHVGDSMGPGVGGMVVQSNGKILIAGHCWNDVSGKYEMAIVRLNANGTLDTTYDGDGIMRNALSPQSQNVCDLNKTSDGNYIVAGYINNTHFFIAKLKADGTLDTAFNSTGFSSTTVGAGRNEAYDAVIQSNGRIVVAGAAYSGASPRVGLVRFKSDGSLDSDFNTTGIVTDGIGVSSMIKGVAMWGDKIVAVGELYNGHNNDILVQRYNADGSLDSSFDSDGSTTIDLGNWETATAVAVQSDGKIIAAGSSNNGTDDDFTLIRYKTDGSLDESFDEDGVATMDIAGSWDGAKDIKIQSDGKIVVVGTASNGSNDDFAIARFNDDGTPDDTFGEGGKIIVPVGSIYDTPDCLAIQDDDKILAAGTVQTSSTSDVGVIRVIGKDLVIPTTRKPDVRLGSDGALTIGGNIYNLTGEDQELKIKLPKKGTQIVNIGIQNDGSAMDAFTLKGSDGGKYFTIAYLDGKDDITNKVLKGSYKTKRLVKGGQKTLTAVITAEPKAAGKDVEISIRANSVAKPSAGDKAIISVKGTKTK